MTLGADVQTRFEARTAYVVRAAKALTAALSYTRSVDVVPSLVLDVLYAYVEQTLASSHERLEEPVIAASRP